MEIDNMILIDMPGKASVAMVVAPTGSYYESNQYKGISHFLEHYCFKGTIKRKQEEINYAIESIGGDINAFTDCELTAYYAKVGSSYISTAVDVITDLVCNPIFPVDTFDKEKNVILQELKMYEDNPGYAVYDLFSSQIYSKESGFHLPVIGTRKTLKNLTVKNLVDYHTGTYKPLTLIVVGNIKNKELIHNNDFNYREIFGDIPVVSNLRKLEERDIEQANILIGNAVNLSGYKKEELIFLSDLLESCYCDMYGRLFQTIREKLGLVYRIGFENILYSNYLMEWKVSLGLEKKNIDMAREKIIEELNRPFSKKDIEFSVSKTIGEIELMFANPYNVARVVAYAVTRDMNYNELIYNYKNIIYKVKDNINELIKKLNFSNNNLVGIVPKG